MKILFLVIFAACFSCTNAKASLEKIAHDALIPLAEEFNSANKSSQQRKLPLLCTIFVNASNVHDSINPANSRHTIYSKHIQYNMLVMRKYCEFAVISYSCFINSHNVFIEIAKNANATLSLYRCVKPVNENDLHVCIFDTCFWSFLVYQ